MLTRSSGHRTLVETIGFSLADTQVDCGEMLWAHLTLGTSALMLNTGGTPSDAPRPEVELYVCVEDLDATYARVAPVAERVEPIHDTGYGMRESIVRDPNRFWLTFGQPLTGRDAAA